MSVSEKYAYIFTYLKSLHYHYAENWARECVDFYMSSNPNITLPVLKEEVKQQWLLSNLRDAKIPSLPPNLKDSLKVTLPGRYVVQAETLVDSGQSFYSQLQTLRNDTSIANVQATIKPDNEPTSRRCLTMTITDGVQDLKAMEYSPIPQLKLNDPDLPPGFKILIVGPVTARRGMILLRKENLIVCGGEVDVLANSHRLEAILATSLGLDVPTNTTVMPNTSTITDTNSDAGIDSVFDEIMAESESASVEQNISRPVSNQVVVHPVPQAPLDVSSMLTDSDDLLWCLPDTSDADQSNSKRPRLDKSASKPSAKKQTNLKDFFQKPVHPVQTYEEEHPAVISSAPFVYLSQIADINLPKDKVFLVKAVILTLKTKISIVNDDFTLICKICDGSLSIDVSFATEVLENMLGFSPCELRVMTKNKASNPAIADRIKRGFASAQEQLISLNCIFHVLFSQSKNMPIVVKLEELGSGHLRAMEARKI